MTHYRKNADPNFLSGEDLKDGIIKDMPDGVVAIIIGCKESVGYDQGKQAKTPVIELIFSDLKGNKLSKGVIPAKWTYDHMKRQGIMSKDVEDWIGQEVIIYAKPDARFGHVVRFKKYIAPDSRVKLMPKSSNWDEIVNWLRTPTNTMAKVLKKYEVTKADQKKLEAECKKPKK